MKKKIKRIVAYELLWLFALIALSAIAEYLIITIFDLHPVLSVKIQGIIGLLIFGYGIRMVARLLSSFKLDEPEKEDKSQEQI
ncbi:MAG: hypothetical protein ACNS64_00115 [Candidatus Halalkalibacterium sp. M3_1C_030]